MQTKVLKLMPHWIDYDLFSTLALDDKAQGDKIGIISDNLNKYLASSIKEDQYSLSVNLFACADNPHLYRLTADVQIFPLDKIRHLMAGGIVNPFGLTSTSTVQSPPPPPPPPPVREALTSSGFITVGDQYNLVQTLFSIPTSFANTFLKQTAAGQK
jgi:hypothetical protein